MSFIDEIFSETHEIDMKQKIVEELLNTEKNLDTKTELHKPLRWSCLDMIKEFIDKKQMPKSTEILSRFMNTSFKYLISSKREGRKEYIEALKSLSHLESENEKKELLMK